MLHAAFVTDHATVWIEGHHPAGARPEGLFAAFADAGWTLDGATEAQSPVTPYTDAGVLASAQVKHFKLVRRGATAYGWWNAAEKVTFVDEARALLEPYGLGDAELWEQATFC